MKKEDWLQELDEQILGLSNLPVGWDGYKGIPVTDSSTRFAKIILEQTFQPSLDAPELVPGSDGTLQIEWHQNQFDIEIEVLNDNRAIAARYDHRSKKLEEIEVNTDYSLLVNWLAELMESG